MCKDDELAHVSEVFVHTVVTVTSVVTHVFMLFRCLVCSSQELECMCCTWLLPWAGGNFFVEFPEFFGTRT